MAGSAGGSCGEALLFGAALSQLEPQGFFVACLGCFHGWSPLPSNFKGLVLRPVSKSGRATMLAVGAAAWVAHHPVFIVSPGAALLDVGLVDPEEVGEAVIAFALVEIGIEPGVLSWRRRRGKLGQRKLLPFSCCPVHHVISITERRRLAARHQTSLYQHIKVVGVVIAWAGEEVVSVAGSAAWVQAQGMPEQAKLLLGGFDHGYLHACAATPDASWWLSALICDLFRISD